MKKSKIAIALIEWFFEEKKKKRSFFGYLRRYSVVYLRWWYWGRARLPSKAKCCLCAL